MSSADSKETAEPAAHHAELAHVAAAAIAAIAVVPLLSETLSLGREPGVETWRRGLWLVEALAASYLLTLAFSHLQEAWRGDDGRAPSRWNVLLRAFCDLSIAAAAASVLFRGHQSRLLLAGFDEAFPGLLVAAGASAVLRIYSRWRSTPNMQTSGEQQTSGSAPRTAIYAALVAALAIGMAIFEAKPLPIRSPAVVTPMPLRGVRDPQLVSRRNNRNICEAQRSVGTMTRLLTFIPSSLP